MKSMYFGTYCYFSLLINVWVRFYDAYIRQTILTRAIECYPIIYLLQTHPVHLIIYFNIHDFNTVSYFRDSYCYLCDRIVIILWVYKLGYEMIQGNMKSYIIFIISKYLHLIWVLSKTALFHSWSDKVISLGYGHTNCCSHPTVVTTVSVLWTFISHSVYVQLSVLVNK